MLLPEPNTLRMREHIDQAHAIHHYRQKLLWSNRNTQNVAEFLHIQTIMPELEGRESKFMELEWFQAAYMWLLCDYTRMKRFYEPETMQRELFYRNKE